VSLAGRLSRRRRLRRLSATVASDLGTDHIGSLELLEWVRLSARPPVSVIYDLGANVGTWTALARAVFPSAVVHAFEPLPQHFAGFEQRTRGWDGVVLHRVALGACPGFADMDVTSYSDAASLLPLAPASTEYFGLTSGVRVRVPVARLDDWRGERSLPQPDLLKLDLQGYELEALRGAEATLPGVRYVLTEVSFVELYRGQPLFTEVVAFLAHRGFHLTGLGHDGAAWVPLVTTDALFTRRTPPPRQP
jgi:FkbM family methyltransferase